MKAATFGDLFQEYLEKRISQGGDVDSIVGLVLVHQGYSSRLFSFAQFLETESPFSCIKCGRSFYLKVERAAEEDDQVLCDACCAGN